VDSVAIDARTAAYGSTFAYCIVRLTPVTPLLPGEAPKPLGAGSENAPYASRLGRGCGADGMLYAAGRGIANSR
jgi:hypothetical protein